MNEINKLPFTVEYAFLSPIFDSISKKGYISNFDLVDVKEGLKSSNINVVALGGVTVGHEEVLKNTGFCGMARLGDFWK